MANIYGSDKNVLKLLKVKKTLKNVVLRCAKVEQKLSDAKDWMRKKKDCLLDADKDFKKIVSLSFSSFKSSVRLNFHKCAFSVEVCL